VYIGDSDEAASHTVTLFETTAVYEFIDNPEQVIVYRPASPEHNAQFILLDPATKRRTEVDADRVTRLMKKLAGWAAEQEDEVLKFAAAPKFKETYDAESGSLTLAHPEWTYRVATVAAEDDAALKRFREFADRFAELSTMLHGAPPPGPRLELNAALVAHGVAPVEIRRIISGDEKNQVRAVHIFSWRLSREDRARLDEARERLANYAKVANDEFLAARAKKDAIRGQSE
jgi:hypothetical protein